MPQAEPPSLVVVVASQNAVGTVASCLEALEAQRAAGVTRIVVVDNSVDGTAELVRRRFPGVILIEQSGQALVPQLWGVGVLGCQEDIVALTTAEMRPAEQWARELLQAYARGQWAGVGGSILPSPGLSAKHQAVYWLRYSRHVRQPAASPVRDIAADNGSYRRASLTPYEDFIRREGYWEHEINQQLSRHGERLYFIPSALMYYLGGTRLADFAAQRLAHGRRFGLQRQAGRPRLWRWLMVAAWPLATSAFLARIVANALRAGGGRSLARSLPVLVYLLGCWSVGELQGTVAAALGRE